MGSFLLSHLLDNKLVSADRGHVVLTFLSLSHSSTLSEMLCEAQNVFYLPAKPMGRSWGRSRVAPHRILTRQRDALLSRSWLLHIARRTVCCVCVGLDAHPVCSLLGVERASSNIGKRGDLSKRRCSCVEELLVVPCSFQSRPQKALRPS